MLQDHFRKYFIPAMVCSFLALIIINMTAHDVYAQSFGDANPQGISAGDFEIYDEAVQEEIKENFPDFFDSGDQYLDSGAIDLQQKMYDDISGIRAGIEIIVYFIIPVVVSFFLIWKFCSWFYNTFIDSVWNK